MIHTTLNSASAISAYATSLLAKAGVKTGVTTREDTQEAGKLSKPGQSLKAELAAPVRNHKTEVAQGALAKSATALGSELRVAMAKSGVTLTGSVDFALDAKGQLTVKGNEKDQAAVNAFLKADTRSPSFSDRITDLSDLAQTQSSQSQQATAISLAARHAGSATNVMALYTSFMNQQNTSPSLFTVSASSASLSYAGMLSSSA